jgi:hypothetical protein
MEILWLSIVLYSVGLGLVLHFRPALMFQENGAWKEFGYQRSPRHTLVPFWLFAITWAFISYAIASSVSWMMPVAATASYYSNTAFASSAEEAEEAEEEEEEEEAVSRVSESKEPRAGYYVRDTSVPEGGLEKYIYFGPGKPE